jgi:hypothetical protein
LNCRIALFCWKLGEREVSGKYLRESVTISGLKTAKTMSRLLRNHEDGSKVFHFEHYYRAMPLGDSEEGLLEELLLAKEAPVRHDLISEEALEREFEERWNGKRG